MADRDLEAGGSGGGAKARGLFRFRANPEPGGDPARRLYRVTYSHDDGWSYFNIALDLGRNTCTLYRAGDADYTILLNHLAVTFTGEPLPRGLPTAESESLELDFELMGLRMTRELSAETTDPGAFSGAFRADSAGDWLVVQVFVPGGTDTFILALNERMAGGEISIEPFWIQDRIWGDGI